MYEGSFRLSAWARSSDLWPHLFQKSSTTGSSELAKFRRPRSGLKQHGCPQLQGFLGHLRQKVAPNGTGSFASWLDPCNEAVVSPK